MDLDVLFVGTAGSAPTARRGLPATLVRRGGDRLLFDCGEGTQRQLLRSVGLLDLEEIFISHFHADHFLGLPGLLKTFSLRGREHPADRLRAAAPSGALFDALRPVMGRTSFEVRIVELEPNEELERDGYSVAAFAVDHRVTAYGYALIEHERPGRFDEARARELGVDARPRLRPPPGGRGGGRVVRSAGAGAGAGRPRAQGRARRRHGALRDDGRGGPRRRPARARGHLRRGGGRRAGAGDGPLDRARRRRAGGSRRACGCSRSTHVSQRYAGPELRDEARAVFERTIVPRDFDRVEIPFPERGEPIHHRAGVDN